MTAERCSTAPGHGPNHLEVVDPQVVLVDKLLL